MPAAFPEVRGSWDLRPKAAAVEVKARILHEASSWRCVSVVYTPRNWNRTRSGKSVRIPSLSFRNASGLKSHHLKLSESQSAGAWQRHVSSLGPRAVSWELNIEPSKSQAPICEGASDSRDFMKSGLTFQPAILSWQV